MSAAQQAEHVTLTHGGDIQHRKGTVSAPTADRKATGVFSPSRAEIPQRTLRTDRWWMPTVPPTSAWPSSSSTRRSGRSGQRLLGRRLPLPDTVLLAVREHRMHAGSQPLRPVPARRVVASLRGVLPAVPAALPTHLLLLPQGLLPLGVAVPAGMCCGRTAFALHRRNQVSADHAEPAPVLLLLPRSSSR